MISETREIEILFKIIEEAYGYDFKMFSFNYVKRRLREYVHELELNRICELIPDLLMNTDGFYKFLNFMTINYTELFRDPKTFASLRNDVLPRLRTYPQLKFWHAGCSTGAEAYSLAIMLLEEGLLEKSIIYATDIDHQTLADACRARFTEEDLKKGKANYKASGGRNNFEDYFSQENEFALLRSDIKNHITFAHHNIVSDTKFGTMNIVFLRNILIYFRQSYQIIALNTATASLENGGYLILGDKESLHSHRTQDFYKQIYGTYIYQRV